MYSRRHRGIEAKRQKGKKANRQKGKKLKGLVASLPGCLFAFSWLVCLSYNTGNSGNRKDILTLYNKANRLFNLPNPSGTTDSIALITFQQVIDRLQAQAATNDTLLFFSWLKKGILLDVNNSYSQAIEAYLQAQHIKKSNPQWSDSLLYEVSVHTGSLYYRINNFDSASYFLLQAENLAQRFPGTKDKERLFNDLGVLYYENGNYLQSKNYFTQALAIIKNQYPVDTWVINIQINLAAVYYKLGLFKQSLAIYEKIRSPGVFTSYIFLNTGKAYTALGNYPKAVEYFKRVNDREIPGVLNELAHVYQLMHRPDSAFLYLNRLESRMAQNKIQVNKMDAGITSLYRADLLVEQQQHEAALAALQKAIIAFSGHFNNTDIYTNPSNFTGTFTSFSLFDALYKKATTFEQLYQLQKKESWLQAALSTYNSAISLLRYIEKSYDTDDAKLFLKNNNQQVYQHAFWVCMQLHNLHPQGGYLEQAFVTGERNKASVMYSGLKEKAFRQIPGIDGALIQQERNIKYNLARLSIKSDQTQDSTTLEAIAKEKAAFEIQLAQVQHKIEQNSSYYKLKYSESYPGIEAIREHISPKQAVISFYTTPGQLHVFVITRSSFKYAHIDSFATLQQTIVNWLTALKTTENGRKFKGDRWASSLYSQLVKPVQDLAGDKEQWIIIPDNLMYYLPFESLPSGNGTKTLLETNEISYQFSSRFIVAATTEKQTPASYSVLGFAPFVQQGMPFPHHEFNFMNQLTASGEEIANLPGKFFTNNQATKEQFLKYINQFPVVHLATHAIADTTNSSASFIAFYPHRNIPAEDGLYLEELYGLNMDATRLIIISACETGNGQLVNSEGVLSLTRGFAYAGCASVVNSLWKADDEATSAILKQFHVYLKKGYTKSKALRQAKIDYLHSNAIHKTPDYWAHLILIGNTEPVIQSHASYLLWVLAASVLVAAIVGGVIIRKRKKST
jgi:CHAT domain-containing protein